ncbi:MAG TPA: sigma-70 family RNA polymerase sigma factor [Gemmatimonadales bacterium]|nr:sigma-70 family RNA polymerase sigma factor [Gemmatimonadales bacterium]
MDDKHGGGNRGSATEELILRTVAAHADSLLRTARRFSFCPDDAQDAYQRALEIFMGHAERLDPARAAGWLHVVVKREALAIRRARQKLVAADEIDLDAHEARSNQTPDEQLAAFDLVGRSAEALQRLKPQELRALWLRAQGHSYNDIGVLTGWSYTKVNRCLTEGRRSFLARYADIESGAECERWLPVISAMVDGEATAEQMVELRPHLRNCPGCRATLSALRSSSEPLAALLPVPLVAAVGPDGGDHVSNVVTRIYEMVVGGLHDRAATSVAKMQAAIEATAAGKAAAIAGAAAAVASGGYATVERAGLDGRADRAAKAQRAATAAERAVKASAGVATGAVAGSAAVPRVVKVRKPRRQAPRTEFQPVGASNAKPAAPEFDQGYTRQTVEVRAASTTSAPARSTPRPASPEFRQSDSVRAPEFGL